MLLNREIEGLDIDILTNILNYNLFSLFLGGNGNYNWVIKGVQVPFLVEEK